MSDRVLILTPNQVWDRGRACFFVGLEPTGRFRHGGAVYKDKTGRQFVIVGLPK